MGERCQNSFLAMLANLPNAISEKLVARKTVSALKDLGIRLVAIDFDHTLVSVHTYGNWPESHHGVLRLQQFMRPIFKTFIELLLSNGFHVAIVSFSPQTDLIVTTLQQTFGNDSGSSIIVQCSTPELAIMAPSVGGKQNHLVAVASHIQHIKNECLTSGQILLIDDDLDNVQIARAYRHHCIHFTGDIENVADLGKRIQSPAPLSNTNGGGGGLISRSVTTSDGC